MGLHHRLLQRHARRHAWGLHASPGRRLIRGVGVHRWKSLRARRSRIRLGRIALPLRRGLPGGCHPRLGVKSRVHGCDLPLLVGRDVGRRRALEHGLAPAEQVEQTALVYIKVGVQLRIRAGHEHELSALKLPEEIERLARSAHPATAGVGKCPVLKGIGPGPTRLGELERARAATVDDLVEQAQQADAVDGLDLWLGSRGRAGAPLPLGEQLHALPTISPALRLPPQEPVTPV